MRVALPAGAVLAALACAGDSLTAVTAAESAQLSGTYVLERADGVLAAAPPECSPVDRYGELRISPRAGERLPAFDWVVLDRSRCPAGGRAEPTASTATRWALLATAADRGFWGARRGGGDGGGGKSLEFSSERGGGAYAVTAALADPSGALSFTLQGRHLRWRRVRAENAALYPVRAAVVDEQGRAAAGALLEFRAADGVVSYGVVGSDLTQPPSGTRATAGAVAVTVDLPPGVSLAPGQANRVIVAAGPNLAPVAEFRVRAVGWTP